MGNWMLFLAVILTSCLTANGEDHRNMKKCKIDQQQKTVNCSHRSLYEIPHSAFPPDTREIDLSLNIISIVKNFTFTSVRQLETLDLSSNKIGYLEPMAFVGLGRLLCLNLSLNLLALIPEIFPPAVLEPLQQLSTLRIQSCNSTGLAEWKGIDKGFSVLTNLEHLYMDFPMNFSFGSGFPRLTKLKTISTAGRPRQSDDDACILVKLSNETFKAFRHIKLNELRLPNCLIVRADVGTFLPLQHLTILDLSDNEELGLQNALKSLYGLQGLHMDEINFSFLTYFKKELHSGEMIYLKTICVRFLDLSENFIFYIDEMPSFSKPECLEILNVSSQALQCMPTRTSTRKDISMDTRCGDMFRKFSAHVHIKNRSTSGHTNPRFYNSTRTHSSLFIPEMPSLLTLGASNCFLWDFFNQMLQKANLSNLRYLDMYYNNFDVCEVPFRKLKTLTELDVSGFMCRQFSAFLAYYPRLRKLTARNAPNLCTSIGDLEGATDSFQNLTDLQEIDLCGNKLVELSRNLFITNTYLRSISLSNNKFQRVPSAIMQLTNISLLDLSANAFTHLNNEEMSVCDSYTAAQFGQPHFSLNMGLNPLQCTCETLDFIRWVYRNERFLYPGANMTCLLSNGSRVSLDDFKSEFKNLSVSCISRTWLTIAVVSVLFVSLITILLYVVYRYRVNLRYWFYTKLQPPVEMLVQKEYVYDAFVAYTEDNYQWVYEDLHRVIENGEEPLKLCLHNRDFTPGKPIHENIVDKMRQSRKIVLVVSVDFLNSTYGPLEFEYAGMKSLEEGREDIIVCIFLEDIPPREMPKALRNLWPKITFLKWSDDRREEVHFWQKLREAITK